MPIPKEGRRPDRLSAKEQVFQTLKEWIVDGTLKPGETLNDTEIARYFSVSRTPVREAILLLAQQSLVEIIPSRGTRVSRADAGVAFSIYEALSELAGNAAKLACQKQTPDDIARLRALNDEFARTVESGNHKLLIQADNAFHGYILKMAGNPYLTSFLNQLTAHAYRYEVLYFSSDSDRSQSVQEHEAVIRAFEAHEEERAALCAQDNWMGFYETRLKGVLHNQKTAKDHDELL